MPLLWKKAKIAQISGVISDLRSRRRRSSLLVQTGFPTSLADLIVKNRTRLKKPLSKKNSASPRSLTSSVSEAPVLELPVNDRSRSEIGEEFGQSPRSLTSSISEVELPFNDRSRSEIGEEFGQSELSCSGSDEFKDVAVSRSRWLSAMAKVFFVVILALGTKKIAVGITVSTFLLFFLEFVGKRLFFCSRPCAGGLDLNSSVRVCDQVDGIRVNGSNFGSFDCERRLGFGRDDGDLVEVENISNREVCRSNEIQVIESDVYFLNDQRRLECKREVLTVGGDRDLKKVEKGRNRKLGNAIFKEKFLKKLVPKKFRGRRSGNVGKEGISDSISEASESKGGGGEEDGHEEDEDEEVCSSDSFNKTSVSNLEDMVSSETSDKIGMIQRRLEDMGVAREKPCTEMKWKMGHLVFFVVVLFGLVSGRVTALLLTVAWFLLVKSVEAAWRNFKKMYDSGILL